MKKKVSPVRQQYLEIKRRFPNAILFFRLGDFYETFDEDARITSQELDIVLTSRNVAKGVRVPMAGIPYHAAENYIARLIEKGYHVAICEQVGESPVEGLFPREVVRVVTPGTVVEPGLLPGDGNNYLAAVVVEGKAAGIAYADVSTGEFATTQIADERILPRIRQELTRIKPAEVLLPESSSSGEGWNGHLTQLPDWRFELGHCIERLETHLGVATLDGYGLSGKPLATRAAGAIVDYLDQTQKAVLGLLTGLSTYSLDDFMTLEVSARRNLELNETIRTGEVLGSLLGVLDKTVTPMGRRLLRQWIGKPLLDIERINRRFDQVEAFFDDGLWRAEVRQALKGIGDLERLVNRATAGLANPRELASLRDLLQHIPSIASIVTEKEAPALQSLIDDIDPQPRLRQLLESALVDDPPATRSQVGVIRRGYSTELDEVVESSRAAREWIANLEAVERKRTGIKSLKVGYNKVFGYYIEVTKANAAMVPDEYLRKQTLVNAERYITPEMKEAEARVMTAEGRIREIEAELFHSLCREVGEHRRHLLRTARALACLDVVTDLAEVAAAKGYIRPEVIEGDTLEIREGKHPVVEEHLQGARFVPNDAVFEEGELIRVITGPNMSGKSTYLRQVALIVLMAQMGSFVPARSARLGLIDRIFTRIGAQDEIHAGQSTFMVEMVDVANILNNATKRSLLILDEVGRGTSTYDGLSIAWAVVEYIHNHPRLRARTLFATHYHELTRLAESLPGVRNYNVAVSEEGGQVVFLHKIVPGGADKSYGIHVAELAGLPRPVINRSQEILTRLEAETHDPHLDGSSPTRQLSLFTLSDPLLDELRQIDIASLTPLEALNLLYEWQQRLSEDR